MQSSKSFRGMRDILPGEVERRAHVLELIRDTYRQHGFYELETPIVESLSNLEGSGGGENEKLIYKLLKRGEKLEISADSTDADLADGGLRFDLTVPLGRYYAENAVRLPKPFRSIQIGPVFRAERPQRGRYRQFQQADIDIIGEAGPLAEVELLTATGHALHRLGLEGFDVRLNDRRALEQVLTGLGIDRSLFSPTLITLDKLDKIAVDEAIVELETKGIERSVAEKLLISFGKVLGPHAIDEYANLGVTDEVIERLDFIEKHLAGSVRTMGVRIDPLCIRGLGYYTSSVYELSHPKWGTSLGGGGRYDSMLSRFGVDLPACGVSIGFERILLLLEEIGALSAAVHRRLFLIFDDSKTRDALGAARSFRKEGYLVTLVSMHAGSRSPMKRLATDAEEFRRQGAADEFWFYELGRDDTPRLMLH